MRSFIVASITAIIIASVGAAVLDVFQKPAAVAFSTEAVRI